VVSGILVRQHLYTAYLPFHFHYILFTAHAAEIPWAYYTAMDKNTAMYYRECLINAKRLEKITVASVILHFK